LREKEGERGRGRGREREMGVGLDSWECAGLVLFSLWVGIYKY